MCLQSISRQCPISIPPENVTKPLHTNGKLILKHYCKRLWRNLGHIYNELDTIQGSSI